MPQILSDSFEAIVETGRQTARQTKKAAVSTVKKTVNQVAADRIFSEKAETGASRNHTPLDGEQMKKLGEKHSAQDKQKEAFHEAQDQQEMSEVKQKLNSFFQEYKQKEERYFEQRKQEVEAKKRQEEEEMLGRQREEEQKKLAGPVSAPRGKVRRNIFQRTVKQSQPETRVGTGGK